MNLTGNPFADAIVMVGAMVTLAGTMLKFFGKDKRPGGSDDCPDESRPCSAGNAQKCDEHGLALNDHSARIMKVETKVKGVEATATRIENRQEVMRTEQKADNDRVHDRVGSLDKRLDDSLGAINQNIINLASEVRSNGNGPH